MMKREMARERKRMRANLSKIKGSVDFSEPKTLQLSHLKKNSKRAMQDAGECGRGRAQGYGQRALACGRQLDKAEFFTNE